MFVHRKNAGNVNKHPWIETFKTPAGKQVQVRLNYQDFNWLYDEDKLFTLLIIKTYNCSQPDFSL